MEIVDLYHQLVRREMEGKMKFKDVTFLKREEYDRFNEKANKLGMVSFWRADYQHQTIAIGNTKKECTENVRNYIKKKQEEQ